jgi:hypothetical protein
MLLLAALVLTPDDEMAGAQAAAEINPRANDSDSNFPAVDRADGRYSADMFFSSDGAKWDERNGDTRNYSTVMPRVIAASIFSMRAISVV